MCAGLESSTDYHAEILGHLISSCFFFNFSLKSYRLLDGIHPDHHVYGSEGHSNGLERHEGVHDLR